MSLKTAIVFAGLGAAAVAALVLPSTATRWRMPVLLADSVNQNDADARFFVRRLCGRLVRLTFFAHNAPPSL